MAQILVIDDDVSLLQMMSLMLKRADHTPILAQSGKEGIDIAHTQHPDMIIVDVMMPDRSGYDVCRELREDPVTKDIPLMILTALTEEYREQAEESGADDFVTKPITRNDLVEHIDELLRTGARNVPRPLESAPPTSPPLLADEQLVAAPVSPEPQPIGLPLLAVMGVAGGVGTTTVCVNLGLGLMQHGRSCIVDMNNLASQVAAQFRTFPPRATWVDLMDVEPGEDKRQIAKTLTLVDAVGVAFLASPIRPTYFRLESQIIHYTYDVLAEGFRRVVVDLPAAFNEMSLETLRLASHIIVVVGDDPAQLLTAPNTLAALDELNLPGQQHIVLNRVRPGGLPHQTVMQALDRPLAADLPYEPGQFEALQTGQPLVMSRPDSLYSQGVLHLARHL